MKTYKDIRHEHIPDSIECGICDEGVATKHKSEELLDNTLLVPMIHYECDFCGCRFVDSKASMYNCEVVKSAREIMSQEIRGFLPNYILKIIYKGQK